MKKLLAILVSVLLLATMIPLGAVSVSAELPTDAGWVWPEDGADFRRGYTWIPPSSGHAGIDIGAGSGSSIKAANSGTVICASYETANCGTCNRSAGYHVAIRHADNVVTLYAHLSKITVERGQTVVAGQQIGNEGSTGMSTGPHLHFSVFANQYSNDLGLAANWNLVDPLLYLTPFRDVYVSDITETSATIHGTFGAASNHLTTQVGVYIGTDTTNMTKFTDNLASGHVSAWYDTTDPDYNLPLQPGTTYCYQMWMLIGGIEYRTAYKYFTTLGGHTHSWSAWSVTKAATCGAAGEQKRTCGCGAVETQAIPASGEHTYDNACDANCNVCGYNRDGLGHVYSVIGRDDPTCGQDGALYQTCLYCGALHTEAVPATGEHTYDHDCDTECNVCGQTRGVMHEYTETVTESTCQDYAIRRYTCKICGYFYEEMILESMSEWSFEYPVDVDPELVETKTEYRYRNREWIETTEKLSGDWVLEDTYTRWSEYGPWSGWVNSPIAANEYTLVETRTAYTYDYFLCPNCGAHMPYSGEGACYPWAGGCGGKITPDDWRPYYSTIPYDATGWQDLGGTKNYTYIDGQRVFKSPHGAVIQYNACTRQLETVYSYYRYMNWTEWSTVLDDPYAEFIEERTFYRYIIKGLKDHTYDDKYDGNCNVCGVLREVPGDVNNDGKINNRDLGLMQQYLNDWGVVINTTAADFNENGAVNNRDLGVLQQYLNGYDVEPD